MIVLCPTEAMRKYPVIGTMTRVCTKPCQLKSPSGLSCNVEVGTSVIIPLLALHHDPKHYPDPETFDPERFNEENIAKRHRFTYLPFGEGPRICIGIKFALAQIKVALVTIILHYKVSVNKKTMLPLTMDKRSLLTYPTGGLWLDFTKRNQHNPVNQRLSN
uniref:Cytochrome P450 n=1 Tax=Timema bartmani TaxID=61472 RepID=A0A7R9FBG1_9NEOP|nr:unnamed protein product [Timema bartmani]